MSIEAMKQALEALRNAEVVYMEQLNAMYALQQAIEFAEMVEKGTKAWANTPDGWVDDLRGGEEIVPSDYPNSHQPEPFGWVNMPELTNHFEKVSCGTIYKNPGEGRTPLYVLTRQKNQQVAKNATTGNQEVAKSATTDWEAVAADQAMTIAMLKLEQKRERLSQPDHFRDATKKVWVGLTVDEIDRFMPFCHTDQDLSDFRTFAFEIEGKLKEKNRG
jgi:hypothetical protein